MRIFLLLAAAGAAAIATAAPARPAGKPVGHDAGSAGAWAPRSAHRVRSGWQGRPRPAMGHDRRHRRHGHRFRYFQDGVGLAWPSGPLDPYGNGFFAGGGGEVRMKGDRPHYDYDRSYPYEFAPSRRHPLEREEESLPAGPEPRCTVEHGVRVCRGW